MEDEEDQKVFYVDTSNPDALHPPPDSDGVIELCGNEDSDIDEKPDIEPLHRNVQEEDEEEDHLDISGWRKGTVKPDESLSFTGEKGLTAVVSGTTPRDYLQLMVDDDMMSSIVLETNRYAEETLRERTLPVNSRFRSWVKVTLNEMWAFFGLIIAMGLVVVDNLEDYWATDIVYDHPLFRTVMKRERFMLILSFLHLCNNEEQPARDSSNHDPLFKISKFITKLTENFQRAYKPGPNVTIDEAMVAWRGPLAFRVYNYDKPEKSGIKVFQLCDSDTGYCNNLEFYTGKKEDSGHGVPFDVVDRLITPFVGCGRTLYVDRYYTSPDLFRHLYAKKTLACGSLLLNRKTGLPKNMRPKLKEGDSAPSPLTDGTLNLLRVYDKQQVNLLTTAHDNRKVFTGKQNPVTKEPVVKLAALADYNKYIGAVDRSDQMVTYNAFKRRTLKWWKKAFFHMFMVGILNAYLLYKTYAPDGKKTTHRNFRKMLVKQLATLTPIVITPARDIGDSVLSRTTARHFPQVIKPKKNAKKRNPQRNCVVCFTPERRRQSRYECPECDVGLHVNTCFELYHTTKDFKQGLKRKMSSESSLLE